MRAVKGTLVSCEEAIRQIMIFIDSKNIASDRFIVEDLDLTHLLIDASRVEEIEEAIQDILEENIALR